MSTDVKFFHSEMPGAPVLSGIAGSLVAVLDACLVNGWGLLTAQSASVTSEVCTLTFATGHAFNPLSVALVSGAGDAAINGAQRITATSTNTISFAAPGVADGPVSGTIAAKLAPAGWLKAFAGTNKAAYKSAAPDATGCVARIDDTGTTYARLRAYETMTDVDTGVGQTPTDVQRSGGLYIAKSSSSNSSARKWIVAASDRSVFVLTAFRIEYNDYAPYFFGDFSSLKAGDAYNFLLTGDASDMTGSGYVGQNPLTSSYSSENTYVVRAYTQSGGAFGCILRKPGVNGYSGSTSNPVGPNPINNAIEICPTLVFEGGSITTAPRRGVLPGLYGIPHFLGSAYDSKQQIAAVEGLPGHVLIGVRFSSVDSVGCRYALDITGPWV